MRYEVFFIIRTMYIPHPSSTVGADLRVCPKTPTVVVCRADTQVRPYS